MCSLRRVLLKLAEWRTLKSEEGVTAIEHALIAGITVLAIIAGVSVVGTKTKLSSLFGTLAGRSAIYPDRVRARHTCFVRQQSIRLAMASGPPTGPIQVFGKRALLDVDQ